MSRTCLLIPLVLASVAAARADAPPPPNTNIFGDGIVRKLKFEQGGQVNVQIVESAVAPAPPTANAQMLVFHDGRRLRGELVTLTQDGIAWRRPGLGEPLLFGRDEVQCVVLAEPVGAANDGPQIPGLEPLPGAAEAKPAKRAAATIKLGGSDWLFGSVTSGDGQTFACQFDQGATLQIPRAQIEWLYGGAQRAPAFALAANGLGLTGWLSSSGVARVDVADGTMTVREAAWFGRTAELPPRFEVSFEIPADAEEGTRLWLHPYGLQPNSFSFGTTTLRFGPKQIARQVFLNGFAQKNVKIFENSQGVPVSYRILYDGEAARLVVLRNGKQLGDWNFGSELKNMPAMEARTYPITGLCFDRDDQGQKRDLKFNRIEVLPWSGLVPKPGEPAPEGDVLSAGQEPPRAGKLESLSDKDLVLSGATLPRGPGTFVQFSRRSTALPNATSMLDFGPEGELSVADLEIHDGKAHCRTTFAKDFETPIAALKTIAFPTRAVPPSTGGVLVFRNGDELPGTLLSAAPGTPLRWKTTRGQEVEIKPAQVAGVRFAADGNVPPAENRATVELRNGDRLRGTFAGLDERQLQFQHPRLGALTIERSRVAHLFPNPHFPVHDGASDLGAWQSKVHPPKSDPPTEDEDQPDTTIPWLYLDGRYALRPRGAANNGEAMSMLQSTAGGAFERFEMRFDITCAAEEQPSFSLQFANQSQDVSIQTSFSDGEFRIFSVNGNPQNGVNEREVPVNDKLTDPTTRLNVRAFVNTKAGTIDFFMDGVPVAKTGQKMGAHLPGIGAMMILQAQTSGDFPVVVSDVWLGPWNGELPRAGADAEPAIALTNGDVAAGAPTAWRDGKFLLESEIGPLALELARVQSIEFGGTLDPEPPVARVHLADGSAVNVDTFHWDGRTLTAHSAALGDLHLPADAVSELIFDPPPAHAPRAPQLKKLAAKSADGPDE